jgi:P27 family predicted phage terminase small subunit
MGQRGPAPTPTSILNARGSWRAKQRQGEPQPTKGAPPMPRWLSKEAKAEWKRIVPELLALGLLTLVDRTALACYCQAYAELVEATRLVDQEGRILEVPVFNKAGEQTGTTRKAHPAVRLQRDAFARVKAFLGEFGLTPASRPRVNVPAGRGPDAFGRFPEGGQDKSRFFDPPAG